MLLIFVVEEMRMKMRCGVDKGETAVWECRDDKERQEKSRCFLVMGREKSKVGTVFLV